MRRGHAHCRSVDESGRTQIAEVAAEKYMAAAICTDSQKYDLPLRNVRPLSGVKRPAEVVTEATACSTWWRIHDESVECFGPYRTTRGAIKAEAFDTCNVVASPEPECGLRSIS